MLSSDGTPADSDAPKPVLAADGTLHLVSAVSIRRCRDFGCTDRAVLLATYTAGGDLVSRRLFEPSDKPPPGVARPALDP